MKVGTMNLTAGDLHNMEIHQDTKSIERGKRVPYHLQYIRDGKVNVKSEVKDESERNV
jgi:hypothetical protein